MHLTFSQLTVRIVRQELAAHFDIEEDVLKGGKYKSFIKDTVLATAVSAVLGCPWGCGRCHRTELGLGPPPERVGRVC